MATRSIPTLSKRPASRATRAFVPTPSVEATRTGGGTVPVSKAKQPPKPPMPPSTSGRAVEATSSSIRSTALSPAVDVDAGRGVGGPARRPGGPSIVGDGLRPAVTPGGVTSGRCRGRLAGPRGAGPEGHRHGAG